MNNSIKKEEFYYAWTWLTNHPALKYENENAIIENLKIDIVKINPLTQDVDDDEKLNTEVSVWLSTGPAEFLEPDNGEEDDGYLLWTHDKNIDASGSTFEDAILDLYELVKYNYGEYSIDEK